MTTSANQIHLPDSAWDDVEPGTEALLEQWLVKPGDTVGAGQPVAVVVMVKTSIEVQAAVAGVLDEILIDVDGTVAHGKPLGTLRAA